MMFGGVVIDFGVFGVLGVVSAGRCNATLRLGESLPRYPVRR